jgi:hypothetical protein
VGESVLDRPHRGTIKIQMKANAGFSLVSFIKYDVSAIPLCIIKSFVKGSAFVCLVRWAMNKWMNEWMTESSNWFPSLACYEYVPK